MDSDIADFTTNTAKPTKCARCEKENDPVFYMQDRKPDRPGRYVCGGCRGHYHQKTEERLKTLERSKLFSLSDICICTYTNEAGSSAQTTGPTSSNMANTGNVRKAVAAAQRQGKTIKWRMRKLIDLLFP